MVMSNIEAFAQQMDGLYAQMDEADTASTWLLDRSEEKLALMRSAEELRYLNRQNMASIGIDEQEVTDFLKARQREINAGVDPPGDEALSVPRPDSRSLTTYRKYDTIINAAAI